MTPIYVGILSSIPPILTIILAILTKEVVISLIAGIFSGSVIYCTYSGGGLLESVKIVFEIMSKSIGENIFIIIFGSMLGALVHIITMAGGSKAYGKWASEKIKSRKLVQISTALLGIVLSIDDYFNCLTVGTVMRPITDKHKISRAKFAYIIDATAAPVCVIAPISSWAASIVSCIDSVELNGMSLFIKTIPYNFYAILTILFVFTLCFTNMDFGPMKVFEENAINKGDLFTTKSNLPDEEIEENKASDKGTAWDLLLPVFVLMSVSVFMMLETGGFFKGGISIPQALGNTKSGLSITVGAVSALFIAFIMFVPRKLISFKMFMDGINQGIKTMAPAFLILSLAWTMSDVCGELICTGDYISDLAANLHVDSAYIPVFIFLLAGFLSFSLGTSWGTFGILIPVVATVCERLDPGITVIALAATLSGSVFGDHCSPISDTMVLSSMGAGCNHIDHVSTQMPYSILVAVASLIGYIVAGITGNALISIFVSASFMILVMFVIYKKSPKMQILK
jgi:Na+/H+ antiporter